MLFLNSEENQEISDCICACVYVYFCIMYIYMFINIYISVCMQQWWSMKKILQNEDDMGWVHQRVKNRTVGGKKENREINVVPFQLKYS